MRSTTEKLTGFSPLEKKVLEEKVGGLEKNLEEELFYCESLKAELASKEKALANLHVHFDSLKTVHENLEVEKVNIDKQFEKAISEVKFLNENLRKETIVIDSLQDTNQEAIEQSNL